MPIGPFDRWPAADRLAYLADEMAHVAAAGDQVGPLVVGEWAAQVQTIADELGAHSMTSAPTVALCATRQVTGGKASCDRPDGHRGDHSWEAERQRRIAREYEADARLVPDLTRRLLAMTTAARRYKGERDALSKAATWTTRRRVRRADPHG